MFGLGIACAGAAGVALAMIFPFSPNTQVQWLAWAFLVVILGSTDSRAPAGFAPIAIGLALTLIHLIAIPVTNTSVNPARSTGPAVFFGGVALAQLWLFWVAPIVGAALAGLVYPAVAGEESKR